MNFYSTSQADFGLKEKIENIINGNPVTNKERVWVWRASYYNVVSSYLMERKYDEESYYDNLRTRINALIAGEAITDLERNDLLNELYDKAETILDRVRSHSRELRLTGGAHTGNPAMSTIPKRSDQFIVDFAGYYLYQN